MSQQTEISETTPSQVTRPVVQYTSVPPAQSRRSLYKSTLLWMRTLHIYLTMFSLIVIIVFSFSGIVLNHRNWFGVDNTVSSETELTAKMPAKLMEGAGPEHDMALEVYLRLNAGARGERTGLDEDENEIRAQFTAVGRTRHFTIAKPAGTIKLQEERGNAMTYIADLHTGKGSGTAWRLVIDLTAGFILFACVSGVVLWIALPKRRNLGIISLVVSLILCAICLLWLMP